MWTPHPALASPSKKRTAAQFIASLSQNVRIADNATLDVAGVDMAVGCWVKLDANTTSAGVIGKYGAAGQRSYLIYYEAATQRYRFFVSNDGTAQVNVEEAVYGVPPSGGWALVICEHQTGTNLRISVNARTQTTAAHLTGIFDSTAPFEVSGYVTATTGFLTGSVGPSFLTKRLLTQSERQMLYNGGRGLKYNDLPPSFLTSLVSYWDMDEESGTRRDRFGTNHLPAFNGPGAVRGVY